jgi:hypothetical protein
METPLGKGIMRFNLALAILLGLALCSCSRPVKLGEQPSKDNLSVEHLDRTYTEYDRFKDETTISSAAGKVRDTLFMGFSYGCSGNQTVCNPEVVLVEFSTSVPNPYADSHEIIFLADGSRIHPPAIFPTPAWHSVGDGNEVLPAGLETDDFLKLIHAHSVEGRLGLTEFTVQESDLEKWRTFAAGIRSGKK